MVLVTCWKRRMKWSLPVIEIDVVSIAPSFFLDTIYRHRLHFLCASGSTHATSLSLINFCAHSILFVPAQ